jgi:hypothetical protein
MVVGRKDGTKTSGAGVHVCLCLVGSCRTTKPLCGQSYQYSVYEIRCVVYLDNVV